MQKWEYNFTVYRNSEPDPKAFNEKIDKLGGEGWELVSIADIAGGVMFVFKRPKHEGRTPTPVNPPPNPNTPLASAY